MNEIEATPTIAMEIVHMDYFEAAGQTFLSFDPSKKQFNNYDFFVEIEHCENT